MQHGSMGRLLTYTTVLVSIGCGPDADSLFGSGAGGDAADGSGGSGAVGAGSGGAGNAGGAGAQPGVGGQGGGGGERCVPAEPATIVPWAIPTDIVLVYDHSASMISGGKLEVLEESTIEFIHGGEQSGNHAALIDHPGSIGEGLCEPSIYADPLVEFGPIGPGAAGSVAIEDEITDFDEDGPSPIYGVLSGALQFAEPHQKNTPNRDTIVVLLADSPTNACSGLTPGGGSVTSPQALAELAENAYIASGVRTSMIGLDHPESNTPLLVAMAGGGHGENVSAASVSELVGAYQLATEGRELCAVDLPISAWPANGGLAVLDVGVPSQRISEVADRAACDPSSDGYFVSADTPDTAVLCPATCGAVNDGSKVLTVSEPCPG